MLVAVLVAAALGLTSAPAVALPVASPSATDLSFADTPAADPDPTQSVILTNTGNEPLQIGDLVTTGAGFSVDDLCKNTAVPAEGTCTLTVEFSAANTDPVAGSLTITTNGPGEVKITLRGNAPRVGVDASPQSFSAPVGATSGARQITPDEHRTRAAHEHDPDHRRPELHRPLDDVPGIRSRPPRAAPPTSRSRRPRSAPAYTALLRFSTNDPVSPVVNIPLNGSGTAGAGAGPGPGPGTTTPTPGVPDSDGDEVVDGVDFCPIVPGNLRNGCPSELDAQVIGRWRTNRLYSKLISLSVRATTGSRIELRCSGDRKKCGFTRRTITATTRRVTSLTRFFKGNRILSAGTSISVRVTRPLQVGTYKRLVTRRGRKLPKVTEGCLSARTGAVGPCA